MEEIKINGILLFEFRNFTHWVNKATELFAPYKRGYSYVCLNKNNQVCHIGGDFMHARDNNLFPIKVYAFERPVKN